MQSSQIQNCFDQPEAASTKVMQRLPLVAVLFCAEKGNICTYICPSLQQISQSLTFFFILCSWIAAHFEGEQSGLMNGRHCCNMQALMGNNHIQPKQSFASSTMPGGAYKHRLFGSGTSGTARTPIIARTPQEALLQADHMQAGLGLFLTCRHLLDMIRHQCTEELRL